MNHQKIYENLIFNAKSQNRVKLKKDDFDYIYYENHHILPKCLCGKDDEDNLVLLTAKEHYVCHKLLVKIYPKEKGISYAFHLMTFMNKNKYVLSARDYKYARELVNNIPYSKERIEKISIGNSGTNNGMHGITIYQKWVERYGIKEANEKYTLFLKDNRKGENNPNFGNVHTIAQKSKWSKERKGRSLSEEWKLNISKSLPSYKKENHNNWGKIWISNIILQERKLIKKEEFDNYIENGWTKGRKKFK